MPSKVLFLFSDTGGGHRASARAVEVALGIEFPGRFEVEMLDPFVDGGHPFLRWLVYRYGPLIKYVPPLYGAIFHLTDHRMTLKTAIRVVGGQFRPGMTRNLEERRPSAIVSFHPLLNHAVIDVIKRMDLRVPFVTIITDMSEFHRGWLAPGADLVVVPSLESRRYAIEKGLDPRKVFAAGLPVDPRFTGPVRGSERSALRERLGLRDIPTLLLVGGGEGSGNLGRRARAIDDMEPRNLDLQLIVVCGRNERLRRSLQEATWKRPVKVLGFAENMDELMQASDAIVTKAGPGTIAEALISGLPIFLTGYVPGQEEGNVHFVVSQKVGWYVPSVRKLASQVRRALTTDHEEFERMQGRAENIGRPGSAAEIAQLIAAAVEPPAPAEY